MRKYTTNKTFRRHSSSFYRAKAIMATDFHMFGKLPAELRQAIFASALEEGSIISIDDKTIKSTMPEDQRAISQVNHEARAVYKATKSCVFKDMLDRVRRFDPARDTFKTVAFQFPGGDLHPHTLQRKTTYTEEGSLTPFTLPFERIFSQYHLTGAYQIYERKDGPHPMNRLDKFLPHFPKIEEITIPYTIAFPQWFIRCPKLEGPEVIGRLPPYSHWDWGEDPAYMQNATAYFEAKGIAGDTGIPWSFDPEQSWGSTQPLIWQNLVQNRYGLAPDQHLDLCCGLRPNIGFLGYNETSSSLGGMWAGFRYHTDSGKVEFSRLHLDEVKEALFSCKHLYVGYIGGIKIHDHFPEMIVKVFINRPGQQPWPQKYHHEWIEVTPLAPDETKMVTDVRRLWDMVSGHILSFQFHEVEEDEWPDSSSELGDSVDWDD